MRPRTFLAITAAAVVISSCLGMAVASEDELSATALSSTVTSLTAMPTTSSSTTLPGIAGSRSDRQATGRVPVDAAAPDPDEPLSEGDFADPFLLITDEGPVALATNAAWMNVPVGYFVAGERVIAEALPDVAVWSSAGAVWAPSVIEVDGTYVLFYTTIESATGLQCISVATSASAIGPYVDDTTEPLVCDRGGGGSIDPSPVRGADGTLHLLWKADGNCCGLTTVIYSQPLSADAQDVAGPAVELIRNDQTWEGEVVEAPSMTFVTDDSGDGTWLLVYSGNDWDSGDYAIGYAMCESPTGPCRKASTPLLASDDQRAGPGGAELVSVRSGEVAVVFHAWTDGVVGYETGGERRLYVERLEFVDGVLSVVELDAGASIGSGTA